MKLDVAGSPLNGTSRLGLGMATVMREGSRRRRRDLLLAAYDIGFRHFDVAPLYGLGVAESDLGWLLSRYSDCTVLSKYGLLPSTRQRSVARVQRPLRALAKASRPLRSKLRSLAAAPRQVQVPSAREFILSAQRSADLLNVRQLDVIVTHEVEWNDSWSQLLSDLQGLEVRANAIGVSGDENLLATYPRALMSSVPVVQRLFDPGAFPAQASNLQTEVFYGVVSSLMSRGKMQTTPELHLSRAIADVMLARPQSIVLVGSTSRSHLGALWRGVQACIEPR